MSLCEVCGAPNPTRVDVSIAVMGATSPGPDPVIPSSGLLQSGQLFDGKYLIERQIGAGGMSVVYLATEVSVESRVVLKALLPHLSHQPGIRERLLREAKALARIDHPNVVGLKSVVMQGTELFLVMEFVEGQDLAARIERWKSKGQPPPSEVLTIFHAILNGVEAAHQSGIIHRDIKPSNVLLRDRDQRVKVTDFGIAKTASDGDLQLTSGMIGTLLYMAPEQLKADPTIDVRADIYALGILLFEMLTGSVPFYAASGYEVARQHIQVPLPSLRDHAQGLSLQEDAIARLDVILARACAKEREHRYASCEEFRTAIYSCTSVIQRARQLPPVTLASASIPTLPYPPADQVPVLPPVASVPSSRPIATRSGIFVTLLGLLVLSGVALWWFEGPDLLHALSPPTSISAPTPTPTPPRSTSVAIKPSSVLTVQAPAPKNTPTAPPSVSAPSVACTKAGDCKANAPKLSTPLCHQGTCSYQCQSGLFDCGGQCLDLRSDVKHCGSCGGLGSDCTLMPMPQGASPRCDQGRCTFTCAKGAERCDRLCCAAGERCEDGQCVAGTPP